MERNRLGGASLQARMSMARATGREFDGDQQLCMTVKKADVFHSETHSDVEIWEPVGHCSVPLKQKEDKQQQNSKSQSNGQSADAAKWNNDQPKGEAAEIMMNYLGSRSHAIGMVTDRRVKPYQMKEGTGSTYAPDGSEQMLYFKQDGAYLVSLDGKSVQNTDGNETRMASLRHVTKDMQSHKIDDSQQGLASKPRSSKTTSTKARQLIPKSAASKIASSFALAIVLSAITRCHHRLGISKGRSRRWSSPIRSAKRSDRAKLKSNRPSSMLIALT
jgi:hypothetical protein